VFSSAKDILTVCLKHLQFQNLQTDTTDSQCCSKIWLGRTAGP